VAKRKVLKKVKTQKKPRSYDLSSRREKSEAVSKTIIETLVHLLVESRGADVSFKEVSIKSKVPLRTIFRLFKDKEELHRATDDYLTKIISSSVSELAKLSFLAFAKNTFSVYDRNSDLVIAYLFSSFGRQAREILRRRFNSLLIEQILKERKIKLNPDSEVKLALMASLVNAKLWYDLRTDFGYSGKQIGEVIEWALATLLREVEASQGRK